MNWDQIKPGIKEETISMRFALLIPNSRRFWLLAAFSVLAFPSWGKAETFLSSWTYVAISENAEVECYGPGGQGGNGTGGGGSGAGG